MTDIARKLREHAQGPHMYPELQDDILLAAAALGHMRETITALSSKVQFAKERAQAARREADLAVQYVVDCEILAVRALASASGD